MKEARVCLPQISKMSHAMNFICWWYVFDCGGVPVCARAPCERYTWNPGDMKEPEDIVSSEALYLAYSGMVSLWPAARQVG